MYTVGEYWHARKNTKESTFFFLCSDSWNLRRERFFTWPTFHNHRYDIHHSWHTVAYCRAVLQGKMTNCYFPGEKYRILKISHGTSLLTVDRVIWNPHKKKLKWHEKVITFTRIYLKTKSLSLDLFRYIHPG